MCDLYKKAAFALIQKTYDQGFIVLDTETTGLGKDAEIIEVSMVGCDGRVLLNTLVKPVKPIPDDAIAIHGITNEMVEDAPTWGEVRGQIGWLLVTHPYPLVIYNADYDTRLIVQTEVIHGGRHFSTSVFDAVCLMRLYAEIYQEPNPHDLGYKWQKLTNACDQMGIDSSQFLAHRALGDCQMTLALIDALYDSEKARSLRSGA
jgi:DNA polymerase III epsilon subunit-like protein